MAHSGAELVISDSGIGIPSEDLPFIWERFYKVDKAHSRTEGGTGLGLAIAREIIELHKAVVTVDSNPHQGTVFCVRFPHADTK
jgi:signal transduction histidine kinase